MESSLPPCISLRRRCALQSMREFIITRGIKKKSPAHDAIDIANNGSALSPPGVSDVCIPTSSLAADGIYILLRTHTHTRRSYILYERLIFARERGSIRNVCAHNMLPLNQSLSAIYCPDLLLLLPSADLCFSPPSSPSSQTTITSSIPERDVGRQRANKLAIVLYY
jgi:hypothetical protein